LGWIGEDDDLFLSAVIEHDAGAFIQHVGIKGGWIKQPDAVIKGTPPSRHFGVGRARLSDILLEAQEGRHAALAVDRVVAEISGNANAEDRPYDVPRARSNFRNQFHQVAVRA
jgi:hypothetical protein